MSTEKSISSLFANDWYQYMDQLSGGDNVIHYSWRNKRISRKEKKEIKSILQEIDDLTGVSFVKTKKKNDDIRFVSVPEINDDHRSENNKSVVNKKGGKKLEEHNHSFLLKTNNNEYDERLVVGLASARKNRFKIFWRDNGPKDTLLEKYVLRHEIGHVLGLSHPDGDGANPDWTSADSAMSYNVFDENYVFKYFGFSNLDKQALQHYWGFNSQAYSSGGLESDIQPENITIV